jgi:tetratricopeptide (TPR) repeat protein
VVLECLSEAASVSLLCQLCQRDEESLTDDERDAARQLCVDELGGLPLAIEQTAAYLSLNPTVGFASYLTLLRERSRSLFGVEGRVGAEERAMEWQAWLRSRRVDDVTIDALRLGPRGVKRLSDLYALSQSRDDCRAAAPSLSDVQQTTLWQALSSGDGVPIAEDPARRSVQTTWELSVQSLSGAHREMVWLLCNFAPDDIPVDAIVGCVRKLPSTSELRGLVLGSGEGDGLGGDSGGCGRVLRGLSERSLVKWQPSSASVSMHRLLQAVVWQSAAVDERRAVATACVDGMAGGLASLVKLVKSSGLAHDSAATLRRWLPHGDAVQAKRVDADASQPHEQRVTMARLVASVAGGYKVMCQFGLAAQLYRKDLAMKRELFGAGLGHPAVASSLSKLASVLRVQDCVAESARLHREALDMRRRLYGAAADHSDIAASLSSLANVLEVQGALEESVSLHRESLAMRRRLHGAGVNHRDVAESLNNLAIALKARGVLDESERLHRDSLEMRQQLPGAVDRLDVATSLANLANVLLLMGGDARVSESEQLHRKSLEMRQRLHGASADHPDVATSLGNLALALRARGDLAESERLHRESLAMNRRLYGKDASHADVAASLSNLADVLEARGDIDESARLRRESVEMQRRLGVNVVVRAERDVAESFHPETSGVSRRGVITTAGVAGRREAEHLVLRDGDVSVGEAIARGGFGVVHRAVLLGATVCAKVRRDAVDADAAGLAISPNSLMSCVGWHACACAAVPSWRCPCVAVLLRCCVAVLLCCCVAVLLRCCVAVSLCWCVGALPVVRATVICASIVS